MDKLKSSVRKLSIRKKPNTNIEVLPRSPKSQEKYELAKTQGTKEFKAHQQLMDRYIKNALINPYVKNKYPNKNLDELLGELDYSQMNEKWERHLKGEKVSPKKSSSSKKTLVKKTSSSKKTLVKKKTSSGKSNNSDNVMSIIKLY